MTVPASERFFYEMFLSQAAIENLFFPGKTYGGTGPYFGQISLRTGGLAFVLRVSWVPSNPSNTRPLLSSALVRRWIVEVRLNVAFGPSCLHTFVRQKESTKFMPNRSYLE